MNAFEILLSLALVLVVGTQVGSAIKCVECNSKYEPFCESIPADFKYDMEDEKYKSYLTDCSKKNGNGTVKGTAFTMCRVMTQKVGEDATRVIRMCAAHGKGDKCYERTGTKNIKLSYCTCNSDWCNAAAGLFDTKILLLSVISATLALLSHS